MIEPNMATMLAFIATDAAIATRLLDRALRAVVARTFNAITVDGDTSTNDTVSLLANGQSGAHAINEIGADTEFLRCARKSAARWPPRSWPMVKRPTRDRSERHRRIQRSRRRQNRAHHREFAARENRSCRRRSELGRNPAAGRSGIAFDLTRADILRGRGSRRRGREKKFNEHTTHEKMLVKYVPIVVNLRAGIHKAHVWTCDFTTEYVHINASYRA